MTIKITSISFLPDWYSLLTDGLFESLKSLNNYPDYKKSLYWSQNSGCVSLLICPINLIECGWFTWVCNNQSTCVEDIYHAR